MSHLSTYTIRPATRDDAATLQRVAALDSRRPLISPILVAERDGSIAAALSLADRRVVADPFRSTAEAVALLQARAASVGGAAGASSALDRLRAALRPVPARPAHAA